MAAFAIRILLVDDFPDFLTHTAAYLSKVLHLQVVGMARSGREALDQAVVLQPDLVLMDFSMPEMNGVQATRRLKQRADSPRVVILTMHDAAEYRAAATAAGADGFLTKSDLATHLLPLIQTLFENGTATKVG